MASSKIEQAIALADEGFRIFPLAPRAKVPNAGFTKYNERATRDHAQLIAWWDEYGSDCNIGIATGGLPGERQLLVVDFDVKEGQKGAASRDRMLFEDDIDSGRKTRTRSGGEHWFFWVPLGMDLGGSVNAIEGYPDVDIRCRGNLVVAPGSTFKGGAYTVLANGEIPEAPPRLIELVKAGRKYSQERVTNKDVGFVDTPGNIAKAKDWLKKVGPAVEESGGDNHTIAVANRVLDYVSPAAALPLLQEWNDENSPPWDEFDLEKKLWNAAKSRQGVYGSKTGTLEMDAVDIPGLASPFIRPSELIGLPPPREWAVDGWVPAGKTTLISGDGGVGKTLIAQQLLTAVATPGADWFGKKVRHGRVLGVFSEDDTDEMWRRQVDICQSMHLPMDSLNDVNWWTLDSVAEAGCVLMSFTRENPEGKIGMFFRRLDDALEQLKPAMVVLDPIANMFGGNELDRAQVTGFVNRTLNRLCTKHKTTMIALVHPSLSGMTEGTGRSGSTGWANAVRSRLYLTRPEGDKLGDYRELRPTKNNYGRLSDQVKIRWSAGAFVAATAGSATDPDLVADRALFAALQVLIDERNMALSPIDTTRNYAVRQAMKLDETTGLTKDALGRSLERLIRDGTIGINTAKDAGGRSREVLTIEIDHDKFEQPKDNLDE